MCRSPSRLIFIGFMALFLVTMVGSVTSVDAQVFPGDFIEDGTLFVYVALDDMNIKDYSVGTPLPLNLDAPMDLTLQLNATGTHNLNVSGTITFWYQGIALFPIQIIDTSNNTWFNIDPAVSIPPVTASMDFSGMMSLGPLNLATGVFQATVDFRYYVEGNATQNILQHQFEFLLPSTLFDIITSVTGITASVATVGAVYGVAVGFNSLWEGLKTAYKLRGIHKKASEIRSLPNLTVLGALPLLFSLLDSMKKSKKEGREDSGVSEYILRQRLREVAPDAWQVDKCPQCKRDWDKKLDMCKKCNFTQDDARVAYAELLASKVPTALRWMGKKKSTDVKTLAKKTKSTQYNAGVIAAAMVDTEVTEITKVGTPLRSFVMNIAGLAFLIVTWQQLLGDSSSSWQTTITLVGAALSLGVIIALYITRKTQIKQFVADQDAGKKLLPTDEEAAAEAESEEEGEEETEDTSEEVEETSEDEVEEDKGESESSVDDESEEESYEEESVDASEDSDTSDDYEDEDETSDEE
ncbi:MAG: hypothetical protein KGD60_01095 [Candidatus Thorarchaeota archaeon]|nr:hypothetical protein [Candidatus Thorarchaeota archaeon]